MNMQALFWFVLLVVFILVEASTVTMVSMWFVVGALLAMIVSFFCDWIWLQVLVFLAVSIVMLLLLRPIVRKYIHPKKERTNVDSVIGTTCRVVSDIDNVESVGQVKIGGIEWSARSTDGTPIEKDTLVKVDRVEGVKVFVTAVK